MKHLSKLAALLFVACTAAAASAQIRYDSSGLTVGESRPDDAGDKIVLQGFKGMEWRSAEGSAFKIDLWSESNPAIASGTKVVDFFAMTGPGVYIDFSCQAVYQGQTLVAGAVQEAMEKVGASSAIELTNLLEVVEGAEGLPVITAESAEAVSLSDDGGQTLDVAATIQLLVESVSCLRTQVYETEQEIANYVQSNE